MDQLDFELKLTVIGMDIPDFIDMLETCGFDTQARQAEQQFKEQMENI